VADLEDVLSAADANFEDSLARLKDLARIRSISTDPAFAGDCRRAAEWLVGELNRLGFDASVRDTAGHPMVVAHGGRRDDAARHVLFYGHYDVQPVDPLELWTEDPFEPSVKEIAPGRKVITGRGTSDDKGQLLTFVEACRAWRQTRGEVPLRVTILFEGEEESGSPSLKPFLESNADELRAELALVCDTGMWDAQTPAIAVSLRGLTGEEVTVHAANRDLHSGYYGGAAANPIHVLTAVLGDMHDDTGRVAIPGFYEGVRETPDDIKTMWEGLGRTAEGFLADIGLSQLSGEEGRSVLELTWARPTAEINGITGGYTGAGFKTVIPAEASAKVSFRLVGDQDPDAIRAAFREFVRQRIPSDCTVEFKAHGTSGAIHLPYDSPDLTKAKDALSREWGKPAALIGMGGSIPVVGDFQSMLGMNSLLVGFALDDDRIHSPNEKYDLRSYQKGIRSWVRIIDALST